MGHFLPLLVVFVGMGLLVAVACLPLSLGTSILVARRYGQPARRPILLGLLVSEPLVFCWWLGTGFCVPSHGPMTAIILNGLTVLLSVGSTLMVATSVCKPQ